MRVSLLNISLLAFVSFPVHGFQQQLALKKSSITFLSANEKEDYLPEISFGAEVVPDGQRPVNEYLDLIKAPLFDWGSNDVGGNGVREDYFFFLASTL